MSLIQSLEIVSIYCVVVHLSLIICVIFTSCSLAFSFSKCHAELKVPVDPHTPGIFDGEEFNRAARFFTYGYDVYTPNRVCKL